MSPGDTSPPPRTSGERAAQLAQTFFQWLIAAGLDRVIASPGSRSTPLIVAAARTGGLTLDIQHDERVAGFVALGFARAARKPVALICTSGSAGAHYLPALLEAHHSGVPLLALTADRPRHLQHRGAPQTVDQSNFFAGCTRLTRMLPDADTLDRDEVIELAEQTWSSLLSTPGPVHINWPFDEPLEPDPAPSDPAPVSAPRPLGPLPLLPSPELDAILTGERGMIVVGPDDHPAAVRERILGISGERGWPVFADIGSGLRTDNPPDSVVPWIEPAFAAGGLAEHEPPDVILRIGRMPTAKAFSQWLVRHPHIRVALVNSHVETHDFTQTADLVVQGPAAAVLDGIAAGGEADPAWLKTWVTASQRAEAAAVLPAAAEAQLIASAIHRLPDGVSLHLANSMPIRHADGFAGNVGAQLRVFVNRGTNGIDGSVATAVGEGLALDRPAVAIVGDIAFLHDVGGLLAAGRAGLNLTVVVIDNGGGGIFSFLPIADVLGDAEFERLFHTPHGTDIAGLAEAAGARVGSDLRNIEEAVETSGLDVIVAKADPRLSTDTFRAARQAATRAMVDVG